MEYRDEFEREFMNRTLALMSEYDGELNATHLINCLLGLLVIPKEKFLKRIPQDSVDSFEDWGIPKDAVEEFGGSSRKNGEPRPKTLRTLVWRLRNSVAHFEIEPQSEGGQCVGFEFKDESGFRAVLSLEEIKNFVIKLAEHLNRETDA